MSDAKKRRHTELSLARKAELIDFYERKAKVSYREVAAYFDVSTTTVSNILSNKETIRKNASCLKYSEEIFRIKKPKNEVLDTYMYKWFQNKARKMLSVSGKNIQDEALRISKTLGMEKFKASEGWLDKFKHRYNIVGNTFHGESGSVDMRIVDRWKSEHQEYIESYEIQNIFNVDETGLFWKCTPRRSLILKDEPVKGAKFSKERITIMFCCSAVGEKLPPIVIGKAKSPRCFKGRKLPLEYFGNNSSWMTTEIFSDWLKSFDMKMTQEKRKVLLLLDNAPVHPCQFNLTSEKLLFFPKNSTSVIQPLDQGIIRSFKCLYRYKLMTHLLSQKEISVGSEEIPNISLFYSIHWVHQAWQEVSQETISNCFKHANFCTNQQISNQNEKLLSSFIIDGTVTVDDFVSFDDNTDTSENIADDITDDTLLNEILKNDSSEQIDGENEDEMDSSEVQKISKFKNIDEIISNYEEIMLYFEKFEINDSFTENLMKVRSNISHFKCTSAKKQTSLKKFFS